MPIYNAPLLPLDPSECKRYAGLSSQAEFPNVLIEKACLEAQTLIAPQGVWEIYPYDNKHNKILAEQPLTLTGNNIIRHLQAAEKIAVLAVTIGVYLETEVTRHFETGDYTLGLLLDAAGTTAVEANADSLSAIIAQKAAPKGFSPLSRFSPGYGDWAVTSQPDILRLAGAAQIGIHTTPTFMLLPRKSVTAVIGLVPNAGTSHRLCTTNTCKNCNQPHCLARKES